MRNGCSGFVLLIVMIFLHILSLLSLYNLEAIKNSYKVTELRWNQLSTADTSSRLLEDLEKSLLSGKADCRMSVMSTSDINNKSTDWYMHSACRVTRDGNDYYYFIENLGQDACVGLIDGQTNEQLRADFYRISLVSFDLDGHESKRLFQSVVAKQSDKHMICSSGVRLVKVGVQLRRQLS
jgi:Tfp pilus assembly protein PilX